MQMRVSERALGAVTVLVVVGPVSLPAGASKGLTRCARAVKYRHARNGARRLCQTVGVESVDRIDVIDTYVIYFVRYRRLWILIREK